MAAIHHSPFKIQHSIPPLLAFLLLSACAVSREVTLSDGWPTFQINCSGPLASFGDCLAKAGDI